MHDAFVLRKSLLLLSAIPAAFAIYFALVTLADLVSHYVLKLKPSRNVDSAKLFLSERVTPEQFDAYFDTRRWIRCGSLSTALLVKGLAFVFAPVLCLKIFCATYVISTWLGIGCVRFLEILRPKLFHRDDRYYVPYRGSRPGFLSVSQWAANSISGRHPVGPLDT